MFRPRARAILVKPKKKGRRRRRKKKETKGKGKETDIPGKKWISLPFPSINHDQSLANCFRDVHPTNDNATL
jgi:hypothetical protein